MNAEEIYAGTLFALGAVILWAGAVDGYFWINDQPTITDFLRSHPRWFLAPLVGVMVFAAVITTHLFLSGK